MVKKRNGQEEEQRRSELKISSKRMKDQIEDYYYKLKWLWKRQKNREKSIGLDGVKKKKQKQLSDIRALKEGAKMETKTYAT